MIEAHHARRTPAVAVNGPGRRVRPTRPTGQPAGGGRNAVYHRAGTSQPALDARGAVGCGAVSQEPRPAPPDAAHAAGTAVPAARRGLPRPGGAPLRPVPR